jgi:hypothetical protein
VAPFIKRYEGRDVTKTRLLYILLLDKGVAIQHHNLLAHHSHFEAFVMYHQTHCHVHLVPPVLNVHSIHVKMIPIQREKNP